MKRNRKDTKKSQALHKPEPRLADRQGMASTEAKKYSFKTTSAEGVEGPERIITQDLCKTTGVHSPEAAEWILNQVTNARVWPRLTPENAMEKSIAAITEMAPGSATEAMLATQMIAANDAALMFLFRATRDNQDPVITDMNVLRAARLMRVFNEQVETLLKLQGKAGQQKVTVEHVHVHEGGQAIVGAVSTAKGEGDGGQL
jgi:hypothetical protein